MAPSTDPIRGDVPPAADGAVGTGADRLHHRVQLLLDPSSLVQVTVLKEKDMTCYIMVHYIQATEGVNTHKCLMSTVPLFSSEGFW